MSIWDKWAERIYSEADIGRSIATSGAGAVGLIIYLLSSDFAIAAFSAIIVFPAIRLLASFLHQRAENLAKLKNQKDGIQRIYARLSPGEREVVAAFLKAGGSVMTWGQMNRSETKFSAIESLIRRELLHSSVSADGITETFVLDQDIFDHGQQEERNHF